jgi:CheY-like chemotaxis protein
MNTDTVLIIDDDEMDTRLVQRALERQPLLREVEVFHDAASALERLRKSDLPAPLFVLLDLNMPGMNGFEFLGALKTDDATGLTPIVVWTTSDAQQDRREAYARGASGYFVKPSRFQEIVDTLGVVGTYWSRARRP